MELSEKETENKINEDLINKLIHTEYIEMKEEDLLKYNFEDIFKESLDTIKNFSLTPTPTQKDAKNQKEKETKKLSITPRQENFIKPNNIEDIITPRQEIENLDKKIKEEDITKNKEKDNITRKKSLITKSIRSSSSFDESETSKKEIPVQYLQNPINFVDYLEYEQPKEEMAKIKNEFILRKYEEKNHAKFEILNINSDDELNKVIFQQNELLTCINYFEDIIITGNILGQVKIFSLSDKKLLKNFQCPIKADVNIKISTMDITNDGRYIFVAYSNGNIAMFDIKNQKLKLLIIDIIQNNECLYIKFIYKEGKFFKIIVSEQNGNVSLITIKDGMTGCRVVDKNIIYQNKMYPIYYIKLIEFNEKYLKNFFFLKNLEKYIVFVSLKSFQIFSLINYSSIKLQFEIKNQTYMDEYFIGDISFGLGKDPQNRDILGEEDEDKPIMLMCTSHNNILNLYLIAIDNGELTPPALIGHYININDSGINQIIRIGFLSKGAIYLIDKNNCLKILNTKKLIRGAVEIDKDTLMPKIKDNYSIAEIQKIYTFKSEINNQISLKTPKKNYKQTYMNSIVENFEENNVAILSNHCIYILELINYEDCFRTLQQKKKWMDVFILGIELYKGKITCLKGLPYNRDERKKKLRELLQQAVSFYIISDDMNQKNKNNKNNFYENQESLKHIENTIEIIIEFCIEIEGFDFLLEKIIKMYDVKGYENLFLSKLESFILCDKMLKYEINEKLMKKLIKLYIDKKETYILNKLLLHLDIKSICAPEVKDIIKNLSLLSPMINIFVNGDNPNYFTPVSQMYEMYRNSKPLNFSSYEKIIETKNLSEIINSKEYKGHKILWYIKKCFIKRKYPYFSEMMEEKEYAKFLIELILWLIRENIMKDFVEFDSEDYFEILMKIFENVSNIEIIKNFNLNKDNQKRIKQNYISDLSPLNLVNYIIEQGKKIKSSQKIQLDFHLFIINIFKNIQVAKDTIIDSIICILSIYSFVNKTPQEYKIKKVILVIKNILNNKIFKESDYQNILVHFNDNIFDEIKIFLYQKLSQYKKGLEIFFKNDSQIYNKDIKLNNYIETVISLLKDKNKLLDFKNIILENLLKIGEISENKMLEIIYKYFSDDINLKNKVLDILSKNPSYKYIKPLAEQIIIDYKQNEDIITYSEEEKKFISNTLGLYIQLLCELNKKDIIIKKLKECSLFPIEKCISLCKKYKVKDALIYLYESYEDYINAFKISLEVIDEYNKSIINKITSDIFINKEFEELINCFNKEISITIEILIKNETRLNKNIVIEDGFNETEDLWFQILNKLYSISMNYDNHLKNMSTKRKKKYGIIFEEALSDNIKDVLEKMSIYIGVRRILDKVSEKNKEAGYKEFKPILLKIFETYNNQNFILNSVGRLDTNLCFQNLKIYKKENLRGKQIFLNKCDVCNENFYKLNNTIDKKVFAFKCGHIMHSYCSISEIVNNKCIYLCIICRKNDLTEKNMTGSSIKFTQNKRLEIEKKVKLNKYGIDVKRYDRKFNKLKIFDMNYTIKKNNFDVESSKAGRYMYTKNY